LPEIVKIEVERALIKFADKAISDLQRNVTLLRQLSGHRDTMHPVPTEEAIRDGIESRWNNLKGSIDHVPFTFEQSKDALQRILDHRRPASDNNEQFRDCCIWSTVVDSSKTKVVHFVSNDSAFYETRDRARISSELHAELSAIGRDVKLYSTVQDFLQFVSQPVMGKFEEETIKDAIVSIVSASAQEIAEEVASRKSSEFQLGEATHVTIKGYATPKPSVVAVTFSVQFDLTMYRQDESEGQEADTILKIDGSCSYNPSRKSTSDLVVSRWTRALKRFSATGGRASHSTDPELISQLKRTRYL
jgi:PIN domain